ncbi:hypothetical protein ACFL0H_00255 [Thermodesulfobacteriota bacterium]
MNYYTLKEILNPEELEEIDYEEILKIEATLEKNVNSRLVKDYKNQLIDIFKNYQGPDRDIMGHFFGKLFVFSRNRSKKGYFKCFCECGNSTKARRDNILSGRTKSCGRCGQIKTEADRRKYFSKRIYGIWRKILSRCHDKHSKEYKSYGGRGIKVCKSWHDVDEFRYWARWRSGCRFYGDNETIFIHRKNPYGNYSPQNCVMVTRSTRGNFQHQRKEEYGL